MRCHLLRGHGQEMGVELIHKRGVCYNMNECARFTIDNITIVTQP
jgi:hypothetical protein